MVLPKRSTDRKSQDFKKCGEITAAVKLGKNVYAFHCIFCAAGTCLPYYSFDDFALHMEKRHSLKLDVSLGLEEDDNLVTLQEEKTCLPTISKDATPLTDPLDVLPLSVQIDVKTEDDSANSGNEADSINGNSAVNNKTDSTGGSEDDDSDSQMETDELAMGADADASENEVTSAIIANYEKHRLLWDAFGPDAKNHRKRQKAFDKITTSVNKQMGVRLKMEHVRERIKKMRNKFRNQMLAKLRNVNCAPLWYYDKMSFLKEGIKYEPLNIPGAKALVKEKTSLPLSGLTEEQNVELIEIYKSFPCLWDMLHIGYRFQNQQEDALAEMLQTIKEKMNLEYAQDELQTKINAIRNAYTQEKQRQLQSEREKEAFKPLCKYYEHISFLDPHIGPVKCGVCEEIFNNVDKYRVHKFKHDGTMPFTCPLCNHNFMDAGNYKVHLRRHTRNYPFECQVCGKRYATTTEINVHMRSHTGEKPYFCEVCGQSFSTQGFFGNHMKRHQKEPSHKCTICTKAYYEKHKLRDHMKSHLNVRDKVCNICGKAFTTTKYLRKHKTIHAEKKVVPKVRDKDFVPFPVLSGYKKSTDTDMTAEAVEGNR